MKLRQTLLTFAAGLALTAGAASAQDFKFPIGEDQKFNWKSLEDFKAAHGDLAGQTLTIFGPWRGEDDALFRSVLAYFTEATGVDGQVLLLGELRAAGRHRHRRPAARRTSPSCRSPA